MRGMPPNALGESQCCGPQRMALGNVTCNTPSAPNFQSASGSSAIHTLRALFLVVAARHRAAWRQPSTTPERALVRQERSPELHERPAALMYQWAAFLAGSAERLPPDVAAHSASVACGAIDPSGKPLRPVSRRANLVGMQRRTHGGAPCRLGFQLTDTIVVRHVSSLDSTSRGRRPVTPERSYCGVATGYVGLHVGAHPSKRAAEMNTVFNIKPVRRGRGTERERIHEFLEREGVPEAAQIRDWIEHWYSRLPTEKQADIRGTASQRRDRPLHRGLLRATDVWTAEDHPPRSACGPGAL